MTERKPLPHAFKPGNNMQARKKGMKYKVKNSITDFIRDIPDGMKPWERVYQVGNVTEGISPDLQFQCNKTLGNWAIEADDDKASNTSVTVITPESIDDALFIRMGLKKESEADTESEGEANSDGETTEGTFTQ